MSDPLAVYERLAERLSNTPNGFPRSKSGTELKLLAKMFTPEQAALAAVMHLQRESAADIAAHAGVDAEAAYGTLKDMTRRGLIYAGRGEGGLTFGLLPFVVGSFEESLPYMDAEMAQLYEALVQETRAVGLLDQRPAFHRVIPVEQSIKAEIEVLPYERASELLDSARSFAVRECICRKQKALIGEPCQHSRMNCITFSLSEGAYDNVPHARSISREEASRILREAEEEGLVHSVYNEQQGIMLTYICNCCTCCCGILRGVVEFGHTHALARSNFYSVVDAEACTGCGACLERCHFGAISLSGDVCSVDQTRCMGCGLCATACPANALHLCRRVVEEQAPPPVDHYQWIFERAAARDEPLERLL